MEKDDDVATDKVSIATGIITNVKDIELTNISENDNITDAKVPDVDSTSSLPKKKKKQQKKGIMQQPKQVKITFCTHVGWDGALVLFLSLCIAGSFLYITFLYTKSFQAFHRDGVVFFFMFAIFYMLLSIIYAFTWKNLAKRYNNEKKNFSRSRKTLFSKLVEFFKY